ncbi:MAG: potassium-transporting ATPase subunit KdpA [Dissulfurimicrobium hydrothermale]|uniref:potassium-transporting ATPase subunit KdpA n=1 Tax=Dissulfurimicrobium hydrothermale TaxID=1750598 RepID=UPI003C754AA8
MTLNGILQVVLYFGVLLLLAGPLGVYMAHVYEGEPCCLDCIAGPVERIFYRLCGVSQNEEMDWKEYAMAVLIFNVGGIFLLYFLQRIQGVLPLNPQNFPAVPPDLAFNTAVSYVTNTNWQAYSGEATMSYLTQMIGLTVQNFVSPAVGMAVLVALIRGFKRRSVQTIGNFWVDLTRSILYILMPLSLILSLFLVSQGVVQSLSGYKIVRLVQGVSYDRVRLNSDGRPVIDASGKPVVEKVQTREQVIPLGPAASQIAIKQLGTNGGGVFGANSAHPFENPTPLSNFLELLAILLIPAALCITFGKMVGDVRQGRALFAAMLIILIALMSLCLWSEQRGNPNFATLGIDQTASALQPGGNMEGKETRFGIIDSVLWTAVTTAVSNGSVNSMFDSFTPLGGLCPMFLMQLGEVVFGGAGSGLYGMLIFAIITVFIAGLMVGRTPEYLGKKIEAFEMKMASLVILIVNGLVMVGAAIAVSTKAGVVGIANPGPHGFSEILYAFTSTTNNNGSAFAGLNANSVFYNTALGITMFLGRFWVILPVLAIAGSMARKKHVPASLGTLPTHTPLFIMFLIGVVFIVGALAFLPSLALGPIAEYMNMMIGR